MKDAGTNNGEGIMHFELEVGEFGYRKLELGQKLHHFL